MKILMINSLYPPLMQGGAERSLSLLAEALVRRGDEVTVVSLHNQNSVVTQHIQGVCVYRLPLRNIYWPFGEGPKEKPGDRLKWHLRDLHNRESAKELAEVIDAVQPHVVNTNNLNGFSCSVWDELIDRKIHLVHTARDHYLLCRRATLFRNGKVCQTPCAVCRCSSVSLRWGARRVDQIIAISHFLLSLHRSRGFFPRTPSSVIYNLPGPLEMPTTHASPEASPTLVFGFAGRLSPEKGIDLLLEATSRLSYPNWSLLIAGAGPTVFVQELKARHPDPRIEWLGFVAPAEYHARINVAVVPSRWQEPLGRTVFEAFAAGKSVLCARSGGISEICCFGKVVETFEPGNTGELTALMEAALADPNRWKIGGWAGDQLPEVFTENFIVEEYRRALEPHAKDLSSDTS